MYINRPIAYILTATDHGTMIINRQDYKIIDKNKGCGVGFNILKRSSIGADEVRTELALIDKRIKFYGTGVVAIDCGANIGVHTIELAKFLSNRGKVYAFEAQEYVYYALAGNIAINNCFNASAIYAAVSSNCSKIKVPTPNYLLPSSFGSLEIKQRKNNEFIGQKIDYSEKKMKEINSISIDSLNFKRIDFIKIDVEGMELDVLEGAKQSLKKHLPILIVESIKTDKEKLTSLLKSIGYSIYPVGINFLAIHKSDKINKDIKISDGKINIL